MSDVPLHFQSVAALGRLLRAGALSPVALAEHFLARIEKLDGKLGAFRVVTRERALAEARAAEGLLAAGVDLGPLHGIPYAAKDLYDVKGLPTTAGTHLLADNIAARDGAAIRRLSAAGMVLLGKTNTVQFAYGGAGINHDHGTPHNPWSEEHRLPGGSSSGSGVAVAAGLAPIALGSDTGGSVRIPAALNGITGLKTTVGLISRAGVYPLSHSLDSVGPLARTVEDAALACEALQGPDPEDATTLGRGPAPLMETLPRGVAGLRVAFAENTFWEGVAPELAGAARAAGTVLEKRGARVGSIEFPVAGEAARLNPRGLVIAAEAYAVNRDLLENHFDELDPVVAHRMKQGGAIPAPDYFEATRAWEGLRAEALQVLGDWEALLVPAVMAPPATLAEADASIEAYAEANMGYLRNTAIGNILGLCGLSVPCGFTGGGLPIGLMIYAKPFDEATLLRIGHAYQQASEWHLRTPELAWAGD